MQQSPIVVSQDISLFSLTAGDQPELLNLMSRIYPPAYAHYWKDDCSWYLNKIYGKEHLAAELTQKGGDYYFIRFRESNTEPLRTIGIFKIIKNALYPPLPNKRAFKVHRIYIDPKIQGKGIGKTLMQFAENLALQTNHDIIWLDAMDTHEQAQAFYKKLGYKKSEIQYLDFPLLHDEHRPMWFMHKEL